MRKTNKLLAIVVMLAMVLSMMSTVVKATSAYTNTKITESVKTFTITRKVTDVTNPVTNTFGYKIEADTTENPKDNSGAVVNATGFPTSASIAFSNVTPDANDVATQTTTVDFTNVEFPKVGVYRFKITEISSTDSTMYPIDSDEVYWVTVVATNLDSTGNDNTGTAPSGNMKVTLVTAATAGKEPGLQGSTAATTKKDVVFTESIETTYIEISNDVTGTGADMDKYFPFVVTLPGDSTHKYPITGSFSLDGINAATGTTNVLQGGANTIYLKHTDVATISKLPIEADYTVVETTPSQYTTYVDGSTTASSTSGTKTTKAVPVQPVLADYAADPANPTTEEQAAYDAAVAAYNTAVTAFNTNNKTAFVNNYEQPTLTGLFLNILPFVVLVVLAVVGILVIKKSSKKEEN